MFQNCNTFETITILAIVLLNAILGYVQEARAEQAIAALQAMTAATARVLRDGHIQTIPTTALVPGDLMVLEEGDTIPADRGVMERPPRDPRSRVLTGAMWADMLFVGLVMAVGTLGVMDWALPGGLLAGSGTMDEARTLGFTALVFFQLFNVFNARSLTHSAFHRLFSNRWLWLALLSSVVLQVLVVSTPLLQDAFSTVPLSWGDWLICALTGSTMLWLSEAKKLLLAAVR